MALIFLIFVEVGEQYELYVVLPIRPSIAH